MDRASDFQGPITTKCLNSNSNPESVAPEPLFLASNLLHGGSSGHIVGDRDRARWWGALNTRLRNVDLYSVHHWRATENF